MTEPFTGLLAELVTSVDGSIGAAFIDHYGEAVEAYSVLGDEDYIRLLGAYEGITLQNSRTIMRELEAGSVDYYFCAYENASLLIKALHQDYLLLLALSPDANIGQGVYRIQRAADGFNREI